MDLTDYRNEIDAIDDELVTLFCRRMEVSASIAQYKKANNLPICLPVREAEKLAEVAKKSGPEMACYAEDLYRTLFTLSKRYQESCISSLSKP